MPLLVVLVACGGSSTLTVDDVTSKMAAKGLCLTEPDVGDGFLSRQGFRGWECDKSQNGQQILISVYESEESFRYYLRETFCQRPATFGEGGIAWGANWITTKVADAGATSQSIARVLGGDYDSYDPTEVCKLIR
jgi:hypothetical protein